MEEEGEKRKQVHALSSSEKRKCSCFVGHVCSHSHTFGIHIKWDFPSHSVGTILNTSAFRIFFYIFFMIIPFTKVTVHRTWIIAQERGDNNLLPFITPLFFFFFNQNQWFSPAELYQRMCSCWFPERGWISLVGSLSLLLLVINKEVCKNQYSYTYNSVFCMNV